MRRGKAERREKSKGTRRRRKKWLNCKGIDGGNDLLLGGKAGGSRGGDQLISPSYTGIRLVLEYVSLS